MSSPKCYCIFEELDLGKKSSNSVLPISSDVRNHRVYTVQAERTMNFIWQEEQNTRDRRVIWLEDKNPLAKGKRVLENLRFSNLNILRRGIREYNRVAHNLVPLPHAPWEGKTALSHKSGASLGLWTGLLHHPQAQCWLCGLCTVLSHFLWAELAGTHMSWKTIFTGSQGLGIGLDTCLTCCWRCGKKMQRLAVEKRNILPFCLFLFSSL